VIFIAVSPTSAFIVVSPKSATDCIAAISCRNAISIEWFREFFAIREILRGCKGRAFPGLGGRRQIARHIQHGTAQAQCTPLPEQQRSCLAIRACRLKNSHRYVTIRAARSIVTGR
jgi:hypothetical protein